jgi:hypothetical protein
MPASSESDEAAKAREMKEQELEKFDEDQEKVAKKAVDFIDDFCGSGVGYCDARLEALREHDDEHQ